MLSYKQYETIFFLLIRKTGKCSLYAYAYALVATNPPLSLPHPTLPHLHLSWLWQELP